jgi:hypothetical protein
MVWATYILGDFFHKLVWSPCKAPSQDFFSLSVRHRKEMFYRKTRRPRFPRDTTRRPWEQVSSCKYPLFGGRAVQPAVFLLFLSLAGSETVKSRLRQGGNGRYFGNYQGSMLWFYQYFRKNGHFHLICSNLFAKKSHQTGWKRPFPEYFLRCQFYDFNNILAKIGKKLKLLPLCKHSHVFSTMYIHIRHWLWKKSKVPNNGFNPGLELSQWEPNNPVTERWKLQFSYLGTYTLLFTHRRK